MFSDELSHSFFLLNYLRPYAFLNTCLRSNWRVSYEQVFKAILSRDIYTVLQFN